MALLHFVTEGDTGKKVPDEEKNKVPVKRPQPRSRPLRKDGGSRSAFANPRWIRVVFQPRVAVRKHPSLTAPTVTFLDAGEVVEIAEVKAGWVRLADEEKDDRDVSDDCQAWVLQDGKEVSLGVLCEDWEPRWFCVVYEPQVAVRKKPSLQAHPVAFLKTGEIIEAALRDFGLGAAFSLKQAFGLCCEARAMLEENDSKAELRVKEARELAQKSFEEALADDDELVSKSSLRARRAWRPLRDTEKEAKVII